MRNRLRTRRELLKVLLATSGAAMFPGVGFPPIAMASQESEIKTADDIGVADRIVEQQSRVSTKIKVVGVGGAGVNAVEFMIREGLQEVEFICVDTDITYLRGSSARIKIPLGYGNGKVGHPDITYDLAISARSRIAGALRGADLVFVVAGLGGGTGTGASPGVAQVARGMGILTVATVTTPFASESRRVDVALNGLPELNRLSDGLILIPHGNLGQSLRNDVSLRQAVRYSDMQIKHTVTSIVDSINLPGLVNYDVDDLRWAMKGTGICVAGSATARGADRARAASRDLLNYLSLQGARPDQWHWQNMLVRITASPTLELKDYKDVMRILRNRAAEDTAVLVSLFLDDSMDDQLRVTAVAYGQSHFNPA